MADTIDNKKIIVTNRVALSVLSAIILMTFGATKFYDESKLQGVIAQQNKERIEEVNQTLREYVEQEVGGLRADWERDRVDQNKQIERNKNN